MDGTLPVDETKGSGKAAVTALLEWVEGGGLMPVDGSKVRRRHRSFRLPVEDITAARGNTRVDNRGPEV